MLFFTTFISTNESLSSKAKRSLSKLYLRQRPIYGGALFARGKTTQSLETVAWAKAKGEFYEHLQEIARQQIQRFLAVFPLYPLQPQIIPAFSKSRTPNLGATRYSRYRTPCLAENVRWISSALLVFVRAKAKFFLNIGKKRASFPNGESGKLPPQPWMRH